MAQDGDTITYTYSGGSGNDDPLQPTATEDVSSIDTIEVDYCDGAGGNDGAGTGQNGGRAENVIVDVSSKNTLYIWVAGPPDNSDAYGRYKGEPSGSTDSAGSTEISFVNTNFRDSDDEPFLVGAGGGGTGTFGFAPESDGLVGSRGYTGTPPPQGGSGQNVDDGTYDFPAEGATDAQDQQRGYILDSGTNIDGGGSSTGTAGEVRITYGVTPPGPDLGSVVQTSNGVKQTDGSAVVQTQT